MSSVIRRLMSLPPSCYPRCEDTTSLTEEQRRAVFVEWSEVSGRTGSIHPVICRLARALRVSVEDVADAVRVLRLRGHLEVTRSGLRMSRYAYHCQFCDQYFNREVWTHCGVEHCLQAYEAENDRRAVRDLEHAEAMVRRTVAAHGGIASLMRLFRCERLFDGLAVHQELRRPAGTEALDGHRLLGWMQVLGMVVKTTPPTSRASKRVSGLDLRMDHSWWAPNADSPWWDLLFGGSRV